MQSSKEWQGEKESLSQWWVQRNKGKQQNRKDWRSHQENYTKGTFHAKMGSIKDRNAMDLTEAEDIKKRWKEYTEELYKKRSLWPRYSQWCDHWPRARHPGMWSQVGLRKHHYKQS